MNAHLRKLQSYLTQAVRAVDATLRPTVEAMRVQWGKELSKLQWRAERAEKRRHEQTRAQIEHCKLALYPNGNLQERVLPALYYLVKYGEDFLDQVRSGLDIELTSQHQLLTLS